MRICFISYEYPPDTAIGGIATYVYQLANAFAAKNISTEVICGSPLNSETLKANSFLKITRVKCRNVEEFRALSPDIAHHIHSTNPFDLIEVPEFGAEGLYVKDKLPTLPLIVKLHTPKYLIKELNDHYYNKKTFRKIIKSFSRKYDYATDVEYQSTVLADHILSPSLSLRQKISEKWKIEVSRIKHIPNLFFPSASFLNIPANNGGKTVLYAGRLETRKGVFNLAKAIPQVVKTIPEAKFIFLGKDSRGPLRERSMKEVLLKQLKGFTNNLTFIEHVPSDEVAGYYAKTAVCAFPSLWENFPNVCLEAMSAGRAIVASAEGGMSEMLPDARANVLIDPHDPASIANGLIHSLQSNFKKETGEANRKKVMHDYSEKLLHDIIDTYSSFILR